MSTNKRVKKLQRAHIRILSELAVGASYGIMGEAAGDSVSSLVSLNSLWSIILKLLLANSTHIDYDNVFQFEIHGYIMFIT